jgi:hypothetical protein
LILGMRATHRAEMVDNCLRLGLMGMARCRGDHLGTRDRSLDEFAKVIIDGRRRGHPISHRRTRRFNAAAMLPPIALAFSRATVSCR